LNSTFLFAACVVAVAAAAPLMIALLGRTRPDDAQREAQRARVALAAALTAGVLSQQEYVDKLAALPPPADSGSTPVAGKLAIAIAVLLPLAALILYAKIGDPRALDPAQHVASAIPGNAAQAPDMDSALAGLEQRLQANPDDAQGWSLLVRGYQSAQQFDKALVAMRHVRDLMPEDLDAQVGYAEALALASPDRRIDQEASAILATTLQRDPQHQRALWLSGVAGMQRGDTQTALRHWRALETLLPEGSEIRASLTAQIRSADPATADASNVAAPATPAAAVSDSIATAEPDATVTRGGVTVSISLDPSLQAQVAPEDTLFVFARAASGPRMPLAIARRSASELPLVVTLDDSMSMMPEMHLSKFADIIIGARISKTGNAIAAPGDLQVLTEPMNQAAIKDHVQLTISEVVP